MIWEKAFVNRRHVYKYKDQSVSHEPLAVNRMHGGLVQRSTEL